jgi:hypothetical protein
MKQGAIMTNTPTLYDLLLALRPPLELLDHLERFERRNALTPPLATWLERWRRIYAGQPDAAIDSLGLQEQGNNHVT